MPSTCASLRHIKQAHVCAVSEARVDELLVVLRAVVGAKTISEDVRRVHLKLQQGSTFRALRCPSSCQCMPCVSFSH